MIQNWEVVLIVVGLPVIVASVVVVRSGRGKALKVRQSFNSVFAMVTADRKRAIINHYQTKHRCNETEAMAHAIADRQKDADRFR